MPGFGFLLNVAVLSSLMAASAAGDFYVATEGRDDNPGTVQHPFATLARARDAVRTIPKDRDITIVIRGGTYFLNDTLILGAEDSGSPQGKIIYRAQTNEKPILSGGRRIDGWKKLTDDQPAVAPSAKGNLWSAAIPKGWLFHHLFVDGRPQPRSRRPDNDDWQTWPKIRAVGTPRPDSGQLLTFPPGSLDHVQGNGDVEVCFLPSYRWMNQLFVLRDVDAAASTAHRHSRNVTYIGAAGDPFRIENALTALDRPGEWCVDSAAGGVYYWPPSGKMDGSVEVIAPRLCNLVRFQGDERAGKWVHDVELRGLTFTCTDRLPEDVWPREWLNRLECPDAAVFMRGVEDCAFEGNRLAHLATYAVALDHHARRVRVVGNEMSQLGGGGVQLYGYGPGTTDVCRDNLVAHNHIHHAGQSYWHSAAITVFGSGSNRIALNYVHDLPYAGVMICGAFVDAFNAPWHNVDAYGRGEATFNFRWDELPAGSRQRFDASAGTFTRQTVKPFQHSDNNLVEQNVVVDVMQVLHDGGALYAFACGLGNVWRRNVVHDSKNTTLLFPIYMDDEVDGAVVEGNAVWSPCQSLNKGDNRWTANSISATRTPEYDRLLSELIDAARRDGGWPGVERLEDLGR